MHEICGSIQEILNEVFSSRCARQFLYKLFRWLFRGKRVKYKTKRGFFMEGFCSIKEQLKDYIELFFTLLPDTSCGDNTCTAI